MQNVKEKYFLTLQMTQAPTMNAKLGTPMFAQPTVSLCFTLEGKCGHPTSHIEIDKKNPKPISTCTIIQAFQRLQVVSVITPSTEICSRGALSEESESLRLVFLLLGALLLIQLAPV